MPGVYSESSPQTSEPECLLKCYSCGFEHTLLVAERKQGHDNVAIMYCSQCDEHTKRNFTPTTMGLLRDEFQDDKRNLAAVYEKFAKENMKEWGELVIKAIKNDQITPMDF